MSGWLWVRRGEAPLIVSFPHTGTELPGELANRFCSPWLARKDTDHGVHLLYDFAYALGATTVRTSISRSVIDVNRDPSGLSLYPGQTTTELCPLTTFDGEPLYDRDDEPSPAEVGQRRAEYFAPYHIALEQEIARLRALHASVVLYDAHSIRSRVPRLFDGSLPQLNLGSYDGKSCDQGLSRGLERICERSGFDWVANGRFKGGWTTRHYGRPSRGVHAVQMELACRGYMLEPDAPLDETNWPAAYDAERAAPLRAALIEMLRHCLAFAGSKGSES